MRWLVRKQVYRAFPELDSYSDEQCRRFVRATNRALMPWLGRKAMMVVMSAGTVAVAVVATGLAYDWMSRQEVFFDRRPLVMVGLALIGVFLVTATIGAGLGGMLVLRDWLLIRRIRAILGASGMCVKCRYRLIGLPVNEACMVTCPECGVQTRVDPAMGELVRDGEGRARYQPGAGSVGETPPFWTPRRKKIVRRAAQWSAVAAAIMVLALAGLWARYEWQLRRDARLAQAARLTTEQVRAWVVEHELGPGVKIRADEPNGWDELLEVIKLAAETRGAGMVGSPAADPQDWNVISGGEYVFRTADYLYISPEVYDKSRRAALETLTRLRDRGAFAKADALVKVRWAFCPEAMTSPDALMTEDIRRFGDWMEARCQRAVDEQDAGEFEAGLRTLLVMARLMYQQPEWEAHVTGALLETSVMRRARFVLINQPRPAFVDAIDHVLPGLDTMPSGETLLEGVRLEGLDFVDAVFAQPSNVRWGLSFKLRGKLGESAFGLNQDMEEALWREINRVFHPGLPRVGGYEENRQAVSQQVQATLARAKQPICQRWPASRPSTDLVVAELRSSDEELFWNDRREQIRAFIRLLTALEKDKISHGRYPSSLSDLPAGVRAFTIDPFTGQPFGYQRFEGGGDTFGRAFALTFTQLSSPSATKRQVLEVNPPQLGPK